MFTPIDLTTWPRRDHFAYYRGPLPCGYSVTVRLDLTRFLEVVRARGLRDYPAFIWCVSHCILRHPAFRMGLGPNGEPGHHDVLHPNYTVFHEDDHTFSDVWTAHDEDFAAFYRAFLADVAAAKTTHGMKAKDGQPPNFYCISCVPWLDFEGYTTYVPQGTPALFPIFTYGRYREEGGRTTAPLAVTIGHAAADGWHTAAFLNDLQRLLDTVDFPAIDEGGQTR